MAREQCKYLKEIQEELLNFETFEAWTSQLHDISDEELLDCLEYSWRARDEEESDSELCGVTSVEKLLKHCCHVYFHIRKDDMDAAGKILELAQTTLEECIRTRSLPEYYREAYEYVMECLGYSCAVISEDDSWNPRKRDKCLEQLGSYETFHNKKKAAVLSVKARFFFHVQRDDPAVFQRVWGEVIELDPTFHLWHTKMYLALRKKRMMDKMEPRPSEQEIKAIKEALNCFQNQPDPLAQTQYILCFAEVLAGSWERDFKICLFGCDQLRSCDDVGQYLLLEAKKLVKDAKEKDLQVPYQKLARIFETILPKFHRNAEFAGYCLEEAMKAWPESSTVRHRLGMWHLKHGNKLIALRYIDEAFLLDPDNFFSAVDSMRIRIGLLTEIHSRQILDEMDTLFAEVTAYAALKSYRRAYASLLFTRGIQEYILRRPGKARGAPEFLEAFQIDPRQTSQEIRMLSITASIYRWGPNVRARVEGLQAQFCRWAVGIGFSNQEQARFVQMYDSCHVNVGPKNNFPGHKCWPKKNRRY